MASSSSNAGGVGAGIATAASVSVTVAGDAGDSLGATSHPTGAHTATLRPRGPSAGEDDTDAGAAADATAGAGAGMGGGGDVGDIRAIGDSPSELDDAGSVASHHDIRLSLSSYPGHSASWRLNFKDFATRIKSEDSLARMKETGAAGPLARGFYRKQNALVEAYAEIEAIARENRTGSVASGSGQARPSHRPPADGGSSTGGAAAAGVILSPPSHPVGRSSAASETSSTRARMTVASELVASGAHGAATAASGAERHLYAEDGNLARVKFAINASFAVNVLLFIIKMAASFASGSLGVIAATVDSFLDLLSGSIVFIATKLASSHDPYKYPEGRTRLEPLGIVVFASVMGVASLQLVVEGVTVLATGFSGGEKPELVVDAFVVTVLLFVIVAKMCLLALCRSAGSHSPSVNALAQDHMNDIVTNGASIVAVLVAVEVPAMWFLDAGVAVLFALYIVYLWSQTGKEQIDMLSGMTADPDTLSQLTYLAFNHHPEVQKIDTVRAYHFGSRLLVELDIVLPEDMPLRRAHDIGESLQIAIEKLEYVERAFVHLDFEWWHRPEHHNDD